MFFLVSDLKTTGKKNSKQTLHFTNSALLLINYTATAGHGMYMVLSEVSGK
jgi:hypothetical protein